MGYIPGYENDVFISYAHIDNEPLLEGKRGWVDFLEDLLRKRVRVRLGGEIDIFRDQQLRLYGQFSEQLANEVAHSAVFICILSPRYVESDWCLWELAEFGQRAGHGRIIKVVKTAIDEPSLKPKGKALLEQLNHVLDCRFYKQDEGSRLFTDLQPEVVPDHIPACLEKIDAIAQNLVELLKKLRQSQPAPASVPASATIKTNAALTNEAAAQSQPVIYLAETTKDLSEERNQVKSELLQFNYRVLPDQPLPQDAEEMAIAVKHYLQQAKLSVHLIGVNYGTVLDGAEHSVPRVQYDLAAALEKQGKLVQVVWLTPRLAPKEGSQQAEFVGRVKDTSPDYLQTKLEDLKTEIQKNLKPSSADAWADAEGEPVNVCLLCHEQDIKSVGPLYSHLKLNEAFKVKIPLQDAQSFENQKQMLQASDAVILYYGSADEDWFVNVWRLIQRQSAAGRTKPILARAIFTGAPQTTEKDLLASDDPLVLKSYGPFTPQALAPFIAKIKKAKGGA